MLGLPVFFPFMSWGDGTAVAPSPTPHLTVRVAPEPNGVRVAPETHTVKAS